MPLGVPTALPGWLHDWVGRVEAGALDRAVRLSAVVGRAWDGRGVCWKHACLFSSCCFRMAWWRGAPRHFKLPRLWLCMPPAGP